MELETPINFTNYSPGDDIKKRDDSHIQVAVRIRPFLDHEYRNDACIRAISKCGGENLPTNLSMETGTETNSTSLSSASKYQTVQVGGHASNHSITFDHVFPPSTDQVELYDTCVTPLIHSCLEGYNATVLAYGQTRSGKTHTVIGDLQEQPKGDVQLKDEIGVIPRALHDIFLGLERNKAEFQRGKEEYGEEGELDQQYPSASLSSKPTFQYQVKVQFLELCNDKIKDLLATDVKSVSGDDNRTNGSRKNGGVNADVIRDFIDTNEYGRRNRLITCLANSDGKAGRRDQVSGACNLQDKKTSLILRDGNKWEDSEVVGACQAEIKSAEEALTYLRDGMKRLCTEGIKMRQTNKTTMNASRSRSHTIFTLLIQQKRLKVSIMESDCTSDAKSQTEYVEVIKSKIHFVDLAGPRRMKSYKPIGRRILEGIHINKGLLVLSNVLLALSNAKGKVSQHVPYRDSKLTRLLKGSIGGNHKTLMLACVSPCGSNIDESMCTLRNASHAQNIINEPIANVVHQVHDETMALSKKSLPLYDARHVDDSPLEKDENDDAAKTSNHHRRNTRVCTPAVSCKKWKSNKNKKNILKAQEKQLDCSLTQTIDGFYDYLHALPTDRTCEQYSKSDPSIHTSKTVVKLETLDQDQNPTDFITGHQDMCEVRYDNAGPQYLDLNLILVRHRHINFILQTY